MLLSLKLAKRLIASIFCIIFIYIPLEAEFLELFSKNVQQNQTIQQIYPKSKELYIKYTKYPLVVYEKQRFAVELEARILTDHNNFDFLSTSYKNSKNVDIITDKIMWKDMGNNRYTTKIIYKIKDKDFKLPTIRLSLEANSQGVDFENKEIKFIEIEPPKIKYMKIAINQRGFSNIIATNLRIKEIQTKQYNNKMLMVVCNIEATNGNLEEFNLLEFKNQGIKDFEENYPIQSMYYYAIIPSYINNIKFNYYNPITLKFVDVELPIMLEDNLVSTQTNLNPNDGNLIYYKKIGASVLLSIFILMYIKTKNKFFILIILIFTFIFIKLFLPNKKVYIQKDTKVYILPTKLSTIYKIVQKRSEVEVLMKKEEFIKIMFKNKNIGWIRQKDVK